MVVLGNKGIYYSYFIALNARDVSVLLTLAVCKTLDPKSCLIVVTVCNFLCCFNNQSEYQCPTYIRTCRAIYRSAISISSPIFFFLLLSDTCVYLKHLETIKNKIF